MPARSHRGRCRRGLHFGQAKLLVSTRSISCSVVRIWARRLSGDAGVNDIRGQGQAGRQVSRNADKGRPWARKPSTVRRNPPNTSSA